MQSIFPWLLLVLVTADHTKSVDSDLLMPLEPVEVAVRPYAATQFDLVGANTPTTYIVILGCLAKRDGFSPVSLALGEPAAEHSPIPVSLARTDHEWLRSIAAKRRMLEARRRLRSDTHQHSVARFAPRRAFHLFVKEGDFHDADNYQQVNGQLIAIGKHCVLYVDEDDSPDSFSPEVVQQVIDCFDRVVFPRASEAFGRHRDVDRNGKFTILFSGWLGRLSNGKVSLGGFVRAGDFFRDVDAPFGNQCDMMYLNSRLQPGEHLHTLIAHEFVHAVTLCEHVFDPDADEETGADEEAWLNEAISHVAENFIGSGWSNLDYRISTFLSSPNQYRLVVPDYYRAGLWRCHGSRGSTYLFLRWCIDRFGAGIARELVQSNLTGTENLEVATQTPFPELFRQWSIALTLDCWNHGVNKSHPSNSVSMHQTLGGRLLAGPRIVRMEQAPITLPMASTSFCPISVQVEKGKRRRLAIAADTECNLQVTLFRLPADIADVHLDVVRATADVRQSDGTLRFQVRQVSGRPVLWKQLSWERASLPQVRTSPTARTAVILDASSIFVEPYSRPGHTLQSESVACNELRATDLVFKLVGTDNLGRNVSAWANLAQP